MKIKNLYEKLIAVVLTVSIIVTIFSPVIQISAQTEETSIQTIQVVESEDDGVQTTAKPAKPTYEFVINNKEKFFVFMTTPVFWGSNYKVTLACDIDIKGKSFNPIKEFNGVFDGCGYTVSNLKIQDKYGKSKSSELAFINTLNEFAEIKNVTFDNYTIEGNSNINKAAGLVITNHGTISGVSIINSTIDNIPKKARVTGFVFNNDENGVIENCYIENMSAKNAMIKAGFVGTNSGKITNSSTTISVNSKDVAGGFCAINSGEISYCKSDGSVKAIAKKGATICGGFVGDNSGIIKECSSTGKVEGQEFAGSFAGINNYKGEISSCKTTSDVKSHTNIASIHCGGIAGLNAGYMENCTSYGAVYGCVDSAKLIGGIVGAVLSVAVIVTIIYLVIKYFKDKPELIASANDKYEQLSEQCTDAWNNYVTATENEQLLNNTWEKINNEMVNAKNELDNLRNGGYQAIKIFLKNNFVIFTLLGAFAGGGALTAASGVITGLTAERNFANVGACVGYNAGKIVKCNANNSLVKAKTLYNKHNMCGGFVGTNGETGTIKDCSATGNEIHNQKYIGGHLGGFAGENFGKIENGTTTVSVANGKCTGGFCGNNSGEITNSKADGNAIASAKTVKTKCGGFVGSNNEKGKISNCTSTGSATGQEYVGGFVGINNSDIVDCHAIGKATAKTKTNIACAGGFVSENEKGTIISCTATGGADSRSNSGQAKAGGFVGVNKSIIMSSKASGYVYLSAGTFNKDDGCGGFVGKNDKGGIIDGCYAECMVETTNKKKGGGFVGEAVCKSTIKNSNCKTKIVTKIGIKNKVKFCYKKDKNGKDIIMENCNVN